jgi:hypothetical protein
MKAFKTACHRTPIRRLPPDAAPTANVHEPLLEISTKHLVFRIRHGICPYRPETAYQPSDPIRSLYRLITMAFQMKRRLNEMPSRLVRPVHATRCLGNQIGALLMFVER